MRVRRYGRLLFWITSRSRKNLEHLIELEASDYGPWKCTCEQVTYRHVPCHHIKYLLRRILRHPADYPTIEVARARELAKLIEIHAPKPRTAPSVEEQPKFRTYTLR